MSAFGVLFIMALLSFGVRSLAWVKVVSITALIFAANLTLAHIPTPLNGFVLSNGIEFFEVILFIVLGAVILSEDETINITQSLFIASASVLLLESNTLLTFIISFEAISIISFILVSNIKNATQAEGAVKMFISGAIATGFIVLGVTLYAVEGNSLNQLISSQIGIFGTLGMWIMLMGLFYKLTIVPMHSWAADSYAQVKPSHAAILSGVAKSVVVIATFKIFAPFILSDLTLNSNILVVLAVTTMTLGNFLALFQKRVSKILSYSSIAHAGYMLLAFVAVKSYYASTGLLYMATAYIFMQTALFLLLDKLSNGSSDMTLEEFKGLAGKDKLNALLFTIQLFSLAGIPLLAGFIGKAVLVYAVVDANFIIVALITLLNSALSVAYYAWIIKHIYFDATNKENKIYPVKFLPQIAQIVLLGGTLYFGVFAYTVFSLTL
jgi:NADH-quinone oxidoreductase subunit N